MIYSEQLERAGYLIELLFNGKVDRGGNPYIEHLREVANGVSSDKEKVVALLHDIIEDTHIESEDLKTIGFDEEVVGAVVCLTKSPGEDYFDYIRRVKTNELATSVKKSDLLHNMRLERLKKISVKDLDRNRKYLTAFEILISKED